MREKKLEEIIYINVDFAKLDKEHVYVFRLRKDYIEVTDHDTILKVAEGLHKKLDELGIKHITIVGDTFEISELTKEEK